MAPKTRKTGRNIWQSIDGATVVSESRPLLRPGQTTGWFPAYNPRRVHSDRYEPYIGSSEWVHAANADMAEQAAYNFRHG